MCFFCVDCCVDWLFPSWWWSNEFWGTPVVPVPLSTYGAQGAVKYWDEFARQYLGGYGNALRRACTVVYVPYLGCGQVLGLLQYLGGYGTTLRRACTVVYVPYLWYCQELGIRQYLGGYGTTLPCACTVVYVLYSCCYQVLGVWQYLGGRYGLLQYYLVPAVQVVDVTTWCHAQHRIECFILCLSPLPFASSSFPLTRALNCRSCSLVFDCFVLSTQECCVESSFPSLWATDFLLRYSCCACTIVYVLYSWYCQVLGRVRTTTVPWRLLYITVLVLYSCLSCWRCVIAHDCIFQLSISHPPLLLLS